jgi:hypothetical protein
MPQGWFAYWKGLEPSELLEYNSDLVAFTQELPFQEDKGIADRITLAESTLRRINPREPEDFDYSAQLQLMSQHRCAAAMTLTTRLVPQLRLLRQIGSANDYFNYSSRLETSRGRVLNYLVSSFARSTTSRNQVRLVSFVDNRPQIKAMFRHLLFPQRTLSPSANLKPPSHV